MSNNQTQTSDKKTIKELIKLVEESTLTEFEYETNDFRVRLSRNNNNYNPQFIAQPTVQGYAAPAPAPANNDASAKADENKAVDYSKNPNVIKSPMVGVIYLAPEPGAPAYIKEGDMVTADQTLLLIEAMKTFNPVKASKSGKIVKILVSDSTPVEYGEPLLVLE